jgi:excisionase family DNA binding protein
MSSEQSSRATEALADGCLSLPEAVRFSGVGRSTIYGAMESGALPFVKIGRRRLVPRRALVESLASGLRGGQRP